MQRTVVILLAMLLATTTLAWADMMVSGNTTGSYFNGGGQSVEGGALTFTGNTFGPYAIPNGGSKSSFVVGTFRLWNCLLCGFGDDTFDLKVDLTLPTGILGGNDPYYFTADLKGGFMGIGGVAVVFDEWSKDFQFNNGTIEGSFRLNIEGRGTDGDIDLAVGSILNPANTSVNANISNVAFRNVPNATTPEPTSLLLLGTLLGGLVFRLRRKAA